MGQCIHAGGGCHARAQAERQFRVADGGTGHQVPRMKSEFAAIFHDQDGAARDLAAGSTGGGDCNQRHAAIGDARRAAFDGRVVLQGPVVSCRNGDTFAAVDGRAAPQGDQAVAMAVMKNLGGGAHGCFVGVGRRSVKNGRVRVAQSVEYTVQQSSGLDALIGHDQRPGDADTRTLLAQQRQGTEIELDLCHVVDQGHGVSSV